MEVLSVTAKGVEPPTLLIGLDSTLLEKLQWLGGDEKPHHRPARRTEKSET